jgi:acetyl esterase/lipase
MTNDLRKLRVLCLHGYHGSGEILRAQLEKLVDGTETQVEYVTLDAPSLAGGDFGWWHSTDGPSSQVVDDPGVDGGRKHYRGWTRTRDWLVSTFDEQGPFDGVLGFSQGAALVGLATGLRAPGGKATDERPLVFDFAVVVSGFRSVDSNQAALYTHEDSFHLPSFHIIGRSDYIVPPAKSLDLASAFAAPTVVKHTGGHVIASTPEVREGFRHFLQDRLRDHLAPEASVPSGQLTVPLWRSTEKPSMTVAFPERQDRRPNPAVLVFQGGAYGTSAGSGGGSAEWLAGQGIVGIRVGYRTQGSSDAYPANYADAARAVRIVRARAAEWNIDPDRIGVLGYSAGGHLAALLSTQPELYAAPDDEYSSQVSARPDFVILGYPLISFVDGYFPGAFADSAANFFGRPDVDENTRRAFSNELHVDRTHPPVFIWTTRDDALVPYTHSTLFVEACESVGVPVRFELFPHGPHGMGLAFDQRGAVRNWTDQLVEWLKSVAY